MDKAEVIRKIRGRVEQCRRLAASTTDQRTAQVLRQIADEGEADINRLLSETDEAVLVNPVAPQPRT